MNALKQTPDPRETSPTGTLHPARIPYWKRAHRSWVFWLALFLMLAAMVIYVMSDDLGGWTHRQPRQPISL